MMNGVQPGGKTTGKLVIDCTETGKEDVTAGEDSQFSGFG